MAKLTGNACLGYTWTNGGDNVYICTNSINDSKYGYNNLAATDAAPLLLTNANGAYCNRPDELTSNAPDWANVHYINSQFGKKDYVSVRNEYFDDMRGPYDAPPYDSGLKKRQLMFAADMIWFY